MTSLIWDNKLNPTVELLNIFSAKITECVNRITADILDLEGNCSQTVDLVEQLKQLCELHFGYAEQLLAEIQFPDVENQKNRHRSFIDTFESIKLQSDQCHTPSFIKNLTKIRLDFVSHLNRDTMEICDFIISSYR